MSARSAEFSEHFVCYSYGNIPLVGTHHVPSRSVAPQKRVGIVLLNSALRYRAGPHRLYVRLARQLCAAGVHVLRIDLPGLGDSSGLLRDTADWRCQVMDNTEVVGEVVRLFKLQTDVECVGLSGLCLGAVKALRSGAQHAQDVEFLILLSPQLRDFGDYSAQATNRADARGYLKKLGHWQAWKNLLMLRTHFERIPGAFRQLLAFRRWEQSIDERNWRAFRRFSHEGKPTLIVFGENDECCRQFQEAFGRRLFQLRPSEPLRYTLQVIPESNHIFSQVRWQDTLARHCICWLRAVFNDLGWQEPLENVEENQGRAQTPLAN